MRNSHIDYLGFIQSFCWLFYVYQYDQYLFPQIYLLIMISQEWESEQLQVVTVQSPHKNNHDQEHPQTQPVKQEQTPPYLSLQTANPILPRGVYKDHPQARANLRYKYVSQRSKLNKTTFPQVKNQYWMNKTQIKADRNIEEEEGESREEDHEFTEMVEEKMFIYERINNSNYNKLGTRSQIYFCGFFFNTKKDHVKSRKVPAFQYLQRICKDLAPKNKYHDLLTFSSKFESGNLLKVYKCKKQPMPTYELYMQNDINTKGCTQWFYFTVSAERRTKAKFRLMNFYKPTSLYMQGMKVLISEQNKEWKRLGTSIRYYRYEMPNQQITYVMEFIYELEKSNIEYSFSYGYPYTYTELEKYLHQLTQTTLYNKILTKTVLCETFLGNNVYLLNITNRSSFKIQKPIIYIIARQHPGETPASYVAEGLIETLLSNRMEMLELREQFLIKVVPMCNIDGVINGNYRSNFSGNDINRQWWGPSRKMHPQIYNLKQQILNNKKNAFFFLDLHAHSRKMNSFFYGSNSPTFENRLYPFVCSKLNKYISFSDCSFVDDPSKRTTARVILESEASLRKSLTFEVSFYGYESQKKTRIHFTTQDLKGLGQSLALGLFYSQIGQQKFGKEERNGSKVQQKQRDSVSCRLNGELSKKVKSEEIKEKIAKNCKKMFSKWKKEVDKLTNNKDQSQFSEGSSLDPEHFQLAENQSTFIQPMSEHIRQKKQKKSHHRQSEKAECESGVLIFKNRKLQENPSSLEPISHNTNLAHASLDQSDKTVMRESLLRSFDIQSNLRSSVMVKKLESELQMNKIRPVHNRFQSSRKILKKNHQKDMSNQIVRGGRFKSIEIPESREETKYKNNIFEMKKALKYFIENKQQGTDYDNYKTHVWSSTNGRALVFNGKSQRNQQIKKKYNKI